MSHIDNPQAATAADNLIPLDLAPRREAMLRPIVLTDTDGRLCRFDSLQDLHDRICQLDAERDRVGARMERGLQATLWNHGHPARRLHATLAGPMILTAATIGLTAIAVLMRLQAPTLFAGLGL